MTKRPDDICPRPERLPPQPTWPMAMPIYPSSVWSCDSTTQAEEILEGQETGYVYQRDRHPNADVFAEKCCELHHAAQAVVTSSGMAAMAAAIVSQVSQGDHLVVSNQLYGRSLQLLTGECARLGITSDLVDTCDLTATAAAIRPETKLVIVETIANPLLRVADIAALAAVAHQQGAWLLVDNTFATPVICQPLELGADFVVESVSKMMNGHSDVMLGALLGHEANWQRVPLVTSTWGFSSSPFDCWLAARGLATLHLRAERACANALQVAEYLAGHSQVTGVEYPGLVDHVDHGLARRQFQNGYGAMVTFHLRGDRTAADQFIEAARNIPFSPSLGEVSTSLSHPASTSHRGLSLSERERLGIRDATIRLSVGTESEEFVLNLLREALAPT